MAKDKDRTLNPAAAQLKADKARALKKGKAAITAQRTSRLAQRNPSRLERQIADLQALAADSPNGTLGARDKKQLEELEKQLRLVRKAREKVGVPERAAAGFDGRGGGGGERGKGRGGVLGKRSRGDEWREKSSSSGSETDESVRQIPMPRDTPPPIPFQHRGRGRGGRGRGVNSTGSGRGGNANMEPLGEGRVTHALPARPDSVPPAVVVVPKTTYEAKPVVRDLRKEAVKAFMPAVVARKVQAVKGGGGRLLEEEEVETLEREG
ncbi:MAG: hypothetical protein Q9213_004182, partial [Squamulea squamosa]